MHDFYNNQPTLKSLDKYIKYAKKKWLYVYAINSKHGRGTPWSE